jgi:hypothetical protein
VCDCMIGRPFNLRSVGAESRPRFSNGLFRDVAADISDVRNGFGASRSRSESIG